MTVYHAAARHAMGGCLDDLKLGDDRISYAFDGAQAFSWRRQDAVEITKLTNKQVSKRLYILSRNGTEKDKFQQFIIGQGLCPPDINRVLRRLR